MPIADLQRRDTELGRIRLGKKTATGRADKLDTFRFTSADQAMIEEIAAIYGGKATPWMNEKKRQFEVITETNVIPVYIPPQVVDPWYENWGGGACLRRCDGIRDVIHDRACDCETSEQGKKSKCKPTTRVNLHLAEIPGLGVWRLETHGIYAAGEMVQLSERINGIKVPLPARLHLEQRSRKFYNREKAKVELVEYPVPVLWLDSVTTRHVALGGDAVSQVVRAAAAQRLGADVPPAIEAPSAPALPAPPARPAEPDPQMVQRALAMITTATAAQMGDIHERIVKVGSPPELLAAFQARLADHQKQTARQAPLVMDTGDGDDGPPPPDEDEFTIDPGARPVDRDEQRDEQRQEYAANQAPQTAPVSTREPERAQARTEAPRAQPIAPVAAENASGDRTAAMTRLLGVAGAKNIKRSELDQRLQSDHDVTLKSATAAQLDALAAAL